MREIYICLPVHNEEKYLEKCLISIVSSVKLIPDCQIKIFICLNDCHDGSEDVANMCKQKYFKLNIEVLRSKKGKLNAQEKMLSEIPSSKIVFFIDADTEVHKNSFQIIIKEFERHKELVAIGAFPVAKKYRGYNPWRRLLDNILNIRSRHPESEISKLEVFDYHKLAEIDSQKINTSKYHELRSKIFFHGRMFALRSKEYWNKPSEKKKIVGDDSYLPDYIIYNFGKNKIRIRYDAIIYFNPFTSLREHYRSYKRVYFDLKNLRENYPKFKEIREHSELILDKRYINGQNVLTRFYFFCFNLVRKVERLLFKISLNKDPQKIWKKD
ncbi:glycosyltransferase family 2 protein [Candidatus Pacearchaeota archaeon]|nr:glycosyltransferase family 2 protein [Candidatus Pacearchaeota archaeon]